MTRLTLAFRSFFALLFDGALPADILAALGLMREQPKPAPPPPQAKPSDGALQMLAILQRDARLLDFLMEDISAYSDEQVGAAVRTLHEQCGKALQQYVRLAPVIDGVEGTQIRLETAGALSQEAGAVKFVGNVPASGRAAGGVLRHKGWHAEIVKLPHIVPGQNMSVLAPAEVEVE